MKGSGTAAVAVIGIDDAAHATHAGIAERVNITVAVIIAATTHINIAAATVYLQRWCAVANSPCGVAVVAAEISGQNAATAALHLAMYVLILLLLILLLLL